MARIRISLSTAIKLMFVGALLVWMNTQSITHFYCSGTPGEARHGIFYEMDGDTYCVSGMGWPANGVYPGVRTEILPGLLINIGVGIVVLILSALFFEARSLKKWAALAIAAMAGIGTYLFCSNLGSLPAFNAVSFSNLFKPASESWRPAAMVFVVVWSVTTMNFYVEILRDRFRWRTADGSEIKPEKPKNLI